MPEMYAGDPIHPIIDHPGRYEVTRLDFHHDPADHQQDYLDLTLQSGDQVRRLRFLGVRQLKIEEGFPSPTGGMIILDIRSRGWERTNIEVHDYESSHGSLTFLAAEVLDLDRGDGAS